VKSTSLAAGVRNVVIGAFRREHQQLVDTWFPALDPLLAAHPDLRAYEMPVLASGYSLVRPFIDGGMAVAIPSPAVRERTLTAYTNVAKVIAALQIRSPETITILLVDRSGQISWRSGDVSLRLSTKLGAIRPVRGCQRQSISVHIESGFYLFTERNKSALVLTKTRIDKAPIGLCKQEVRGSNPRRSTTVGRGISMMRFRVFVSLGGALGGACILGPLSE
jgi:hypothetical protein